MKLLFGLCPLLIVVVACSAPSTDTGKSTPAPSASPGRIVANNDVHDPKARFLGQGLAYINNLTVSDRAMAEEFINDDRTPTSIVTAIKAAHDSEDRDWRGIEVPPKQYSPLAAKLLKIHNDHNRAFVEYFKTFSEKTRARMESRIDAGNNLIKQSMVNISTAKDMITTALDRDVRQ